MRVSDKEAFKFVMVVDSWKYDDERGGWDYTLRDKDDKVYGELVKETNTKRAD